MYETFLVPYVIECIYLATGRKRSGLRASSRYMEPRMHCVGDAHKEVSILQLGMCEWSSSPITWRFFMFESSFIVLLHHLVILLSVHLLFLSVANNLFYPTDAGSTIPNRKGCEATYSWFSFQWCTWLYWKVSTGWTKFEANGSSALGSSLCEAPTFTNFRISIASLF